MRRPWNIINSPIYSLATYKGDQVNMNICTYVSAISMQPKQYLISLDYKTQTYENLLKNDLAILQILTFNNIKLVRALGKNSGKVTNKQSYLSKKDALVRWNGFDVLGGAAAYIQLRKTASHNSGGDHEHFFFSVEKFKTIDDQNILMFQDLIDNKIIL